MSGPVPLRFVCDEQVVQTAAPVTAVAADVLREAAGCTAVRVSCDADVCGACSVLVDGRPVASCSLLAAQLDGTRVETVAAPVAAADGLDDVQRAFAAAEAFQCGFCAPGVVVGARALLAGADQLDEEALRFWLRGHLCRCTGSASLLAVLRGLARSRGRWTG